MQKAWNQLHTNKSLGMDGFTTDSEYQGVITFISKPDKAHLLACKYRPIILLNCDHKKFS